MIKSYGIRAGSYRMIFILQSEYKVIDTVLKIMEISGYWWNSCRESYFEYEHMSSGIWVI